MAVDIPQELVNLSSSKLRNGDIMGEERKSLIVDRGPLSIHGISQVGQSLIKVLFKVFRYILAKLERMKQVLIFLVVEEYLGLRKGKDLTYFCEQRWLV